MKGLTWAIHAVALLALAGPPAVRCDEPPASVTGVADLRVTTDDGRFSSRLLFAAAADPPAMRIEVVRAGAVQAVIWYDEARVLVLAPADGLMHEGPPTRSTLQKCLGLPFCPADILHALRGGADARRPCPDEAVSTVAAASDDDGSGLELRDAETDEKATVRLRFSRYRQVGSRSWPRRVVLVSPGTKATLDIAALSVSPLAPVAPTASQLEGLRRVDAATLARTLGVGPEGDAPERSR